jgi:uncharacterized protein (DUF697 family)
MSQQLMTMDEVSKREEEARALVKKKARISSIAAALPIPFLDTGTDMKLMNDITDDIEEVFGIKHDEVVDTREDFTMRGIVMATSMASEFLVKRVTPFVFKKVNGKKMKKFRVVNMIGTAIGAVISYILMKKLGDNHVDKCVQFLKDRNV